MDPFDILSLDDDQDDDASSAQSARGNGLYPRRGRQESMWGCPVFLLFLLIVFLFDKCS